MLHLIKFNLFCFLLLLVPSQSNAQWLNMYAPGNTSPYSLHQFDSHLLMYSPAQGAYNLYHSSNDGKSWDGVQSPIQLIWNYSPRFGYDGVYLYLYEPDFGLYRSLDWGNSWEKISNQELPPNTLYTDDLATIDGYIFHYASGKVYRLATSTGATAEVVLSTQVPFPDQIVLRTRGNAVWASATDSLLVSTDNGSNWDLIWEGEKIEDFDLSGDTILVKTVLGYWRSDNYGLDWTKISNLDYGDRVSHSEDNWFASSTYGPGLYRSSDGGISWTVIPDSLGLILVDSNPKKRGSRIILPGIHGPLVSRDNGATWNYQCNGLYFSTALNLSLFSRLGNTLYLNDQFSEDHGETWFFPLYSGDYGHYFYRICAFKGAYFGVSDDFKLFRSDGNLQNWTLLPFQIPQNEIHFILTDSILYMQLTTGLYQTLDMGQSWTYKGSPNSIVPVGHKNALYTCYFNPFSNLISLFKSEDGGTSWNEMPVDLTPYKFPIPVKLFSAGNTLYIYGGRCILASEDDGASFVQVNTNILEPGYGLPLSIDEFTATDSMVAISNYFGMFYSPNTMSDQWLSLYEGLNTDLPTVSIAPLLVKDTLFVAGNQGLKYLWKRATNSIEAFSGLVYLDENNNGIRDASESVQPKAMLQLGQGQYFSTGFNGQYALSIESLGDTLRVIPPSPHAVINPPYYLVQGAAKDQDFGIHIPAEITDTRIRVTNESPFRPGFSNNVFINYTNIGGDTTQPRVRFFMEPAFALNNVNPPISGALGDTLFWDLQDLYPLKSGVIELNIQVSPNTPLDTEVLAIATVETLKQDIDLSNNRDTLKEIVVGAFDPNDKTCLNGDIISPEQAEAKVPLEYIVRFQNTGSYYASTVRVTDQLHKNLDPTTFELLGASHPCQVSMRDGGKLEFLFTGIQLPPSLQNEPESHGFVRFLVRPQPNLIVGDSIANQASIFFDFNAPIITNTTLTLVNDPSASTNLEQGKLVKISPNPSSGILQVEGTLEKFTRINMLDAAGKLIQSIEQPTLPLALNLTSHPKGVYWMEFTRKNGRVWTEMFILN
jgi:photosystem II stability/assembly factor-like uncharacterized protein